VRSIFVDSGIAFTEKVYEFTIERDYNQSRFITVKNTDTEPHELLLQVSGVPSDLALNFVGEGSIDQRIPLLPGESKDVELVFHAQDAVSDNYTILLNLTNLGPEAITDSAVLRLQVHFPVIDYSIEEVSSDPYTLAKTNVQVQDPPINGITQIRAAGKARSSGIEVDVSGDITRQLK